MEVGAAVGDEVGLEVGDVVGADVGPEGSHGKVTPVWSSKYPLSASVMSFFSIQYFKQILRALPVPYGAHMPLRRFLGVAAIVVLKQAMIVTITAIREELVDLIFIVSLLL